MAQEDVMPWLSAVWRRRRSCMNRCRSMVVARMRRAPLPLPPPPVLRLPAPPPQAERQLEFVQLPLKKRALIMDHAVHQNENEYFCNICGKIYTCYYALGGHKAYHSRRGEGKPSPKSKRRGRPRRCQAKCPNCDRIFSSPQGLGGHKRHCTVAAPPENEPGPSGRL